MGWKFRKSIRLAPGVRVNVSGSGVSTTLGGRGASVTLGRTGTRTTVGIPGTGISYSARSGGGGGGGANAGAARPGGCLGAGCLGIFMLVLIGMCMGPDDSAPPPATVTPSTLYSTDGTTTPAAPREDREWFYIHGNLNVRTQPDGDAAIVRTLRRGDYVQLGPRDANGWARLYSTGSEEGYVYRASELVQTQAPATRSSAEDGGGSSSSARSGSRRSSAADRGYYTGPRGGCYTYSASGRKRYVDRSYCN